MIMIKTVQHELTNKLNQWSRECIWINKLINRANNKF
jgi:hypothetical protein